MSAIAALAANESKPGRFPNLLQARCPQTLPPIIERAAQSQCMTASEYIRRSVVERLLLDGFKIDVEPQQYALVENGSLALVGPANNRRLAIGTKPDEGDPRTWLQLGISPWKPTGTSGIEREAQAAGSASPADQADKSSSPKVAANL